MQITACPTVPCTCLIKLINAHRVEAVLEAHEQASLALLECQQRHEEVHVPLVTRIIVHLHIPQALLTHGLIFFCCAKLHSGNCCFELEDFRITGLC